MQPEAFILVTTDSDVYPVRNWVDNCITDGKTPERTNFEELILYKSVNIQTKITFN